MRDVGGCADQPCKRFVSATHCHTCHDGQRHASAHATHPHKNPRMHARYARTAPEQSEQRQWVDAARQPGGQPGAHLAQVLDGLDAQLGQGGVGPAQERTGHG